MWWYMGWGGRIKKDKSHVPSIAAKRNWNNTAHRHHTGKLIATNNHPFLNLQVCELFRVIFHFSVNKTQNYSSIYIKTKNKTQTWKIYQLCQISFLRYLYCVKKVCLTLSKFCRVLFLNVKQGNLLILSKPWFDICCFKTKNMSCCRIEKAPIITKHYHCVYWLWSIWEQILDFSHEFHWH